MDEIIDQIGSELYEESCRLSIRKLEKTIKEVLERYFTTFGQ